MIRDKGIGSCTNLGEGAEPLRGPQGSGHVNIHIFNIFSESYGPILTKHGMYDPQDQGLSELIKLGAGPHLRTKGRKIVSNLKKSFPLIQINYSFQNSIRTAQVLFKLWEIISPQGPFNEDSCEHIKAHGPLGTIV